MAEWNLLRELTRIVRDNQLTNLDCELIKHQKDIKVGFDHDQDTEDKL